MLIPKLHPAFAVIRGEARIAGLPEDLRERCRDLWRRIDRLFAQGL
jgi:hypothetical protein